jgi:CBS domain-containing membrane protein
VEPVAKKEVRDLLMLTKVGKIMTTKVYSVVSTAELSEAVRLIADNNLTHLPVTDVHKKVVGIVSHMYIYKTQAPRKFVEGDVTPDPDMVLDGDGFYLKETLNRYSLKRVMKSDPFILKEDESVALAVHAMANKRIGCIPIVDRLGTLVGIVTNQDIINFLAMSLT